MINRTLHIMCIIWTGIMAGFFWAFSVVVMPGLSDSEPLVALKSMQGINRVVRNTIFGIVFFGAALLCVLYVVDAFRKRIWPKSWLTIAGAVAYLIGAFCVTFIYNVPLNNALAAVNHSNVGSTQAMIEYIDKWTFWNHIRTISSIGSFVLFILGLQVYHSSSKIKDERLVGK